MRHAWLALSFATGLTGIALLAMARENDPAPTLPAAVALAPEGQQDETRPETAKPLLTDRPDAPAAPTTPPGGELLDRVFESQSAGISFKLPAGCERVNATGSGDEVASFVNAKRDWTLKLSRATLAQPMDLTPKQDANGHPVPGMLNITVDRLKAALPEAKILRQDLTNVRDANVGFLVVRYTKDGRRHLTQQALIEANDQLYYYLAFTTPGRHGDDDATEDPGERQAVEVFRQLLDTVKLMDRARIKDEQDQRLYATRAFLVNLTPNRLHSVLIPEQWLRVMRDGKDVGYSYVTEDVAGGIPRPLTREEMKAGKSDRELARAGDGVLIGIRSRSITETLRPDNSRGPLQADTASWFYVSADRKHEDWTSMTLLDDGRKEKDGKPLRDHYEVFGSSDRRLSRVLEKGRGDKFDPKNPAMSVKEQYVLTATHTARVADAEPVNRELPPFYLPEALSHLLPRLLPLKEPKNYLFAQYVQETREVMLRYVEVGRDQRVTFNGHEVRAVPITDRLGFEGSRITHYFSPDGSYLGSENADSRVLILPTDADTLAKIWKNPDLTRPGGMEQPKPAPQRGGGTPSAAVVPAPEERNGKRAVRE